MAEEYKAFAVYLRDISHGMVQAWEEVFSDPRYEKRIEVSQGDIFNGAPSADAIVSPANSFGFMDGGIDYCYSEHFGWQMQERLQLHLKQHFDGELPVGSAVIIPSYDKDVSEVQVEPTRNGGLPIRYLISAPTMRVPEDVSDTVNAYLAFRAVLRCVVAHNKDPSKEPISSVLCPGLGTAVGRMPFKRAAVQMRSAYDAIILGTEKSVLNPEGLYIAMRHQRDMLMSGGESERKFERKAAPGELFLEKSD